MVPGIRSVDQSGKALVPALASRRRRAYTMIITTISSYRVDVMNRTGTFCFPLAALAAGICLTFSPSLFAQGLQLKPTTIPGIQPSASLAFDLATEGKGHVSFFVEYSAGSYSLLKSYINENGVPAVATPLLKGVTGIISSQSAVWIEGGKSGATSAAKGHGLLFVLYQPQYNDTKALLVVSRIDQFGNTGVGFETLDTITLSPGQSILTSQIVTSIAGGSVGCFLVATLFNPSTGSSTPTGFTAIFRELNLSGNPVSNRLLLALPGASGNILFRTGPFLGLPKGWLIPVTSSSFVSGGGITTPTGNKLYVLSVGRAVGSLGPASFRLIASDTLPLGFGFSNFEILPVNPPVAQVAARKPAAQLFYRHYNPLPPEQVIYTRYRLETMVQGIDAKGKRVGSPKPIAMPIWQHQLPYNKNIELWVEADVLSRFVKYEDSWYLFQVRTVIFKRTAGDGDPYPTENLMTAYRVNLSNWKLKTIAQHDETQSMVAYGTPWLHAAKGTLGLIIRKTAMASPYSSQFYLGAVTLPD